MLVWVEKVSNLWESVGSGAHCGWVGQGGQYRRKPDAGEGTRWVTEIFAVYFHVLLWIHMQSKDSAEAHLVPGLFEVAPSIGTPTMHASSFFVS